MKMEVVGGNYTPSGRKPPASQFYFRRRTMMSIAEMQACLARLYVDDPFRKLFFLDHAAAYENYRLTDEEKEALNGLDPTAVNFFAGSLKHKREGKIRSAYPLLYKLDPVEIRRYYDRYYQLYKARPNHPFWEDILEFGRFMEETLATAEDLPAYASDLAKYERLYNAVSIVPGINDDFVDPGNSNGNYTQENILEARPKIGQNIQIGTFVYDVIAIDDALTQDREPGDLEAGEHIIIFQQVIDSYDPKIFRINLATKKLLDACDGQHTVLEITTLLEDIFQTKNAQQDVIDIINQFRAINVVRI
jgi:hypothetical protein